LPAALFTSYLRRVARQLATVTVGSGPVGEKLASVAATRDPEARHANAGDAASCKATLRPGARAL